MLTVVGDSIVENCRAKGWRLLASNVRTNHVHVVVAAAASPERIMGSLKIQSTRDLRLGGLVAPGRRVWTHRGSKRYLFHPRDVERAINYVRHWQ